MPDELSLRQGQEKFRAGDFNAQQLLLQYLRPCPLLSKNFSPHHSQISSLCPRFTASR